MVRWTPLCRRTSLEAGPQTDRSRGRADYLLDEMERALHDSLCAIKRTLESGSVVPGGGAVETALSIYLENFATTLVRSGARAIHFRRDSS